MILGDRNLMDIRLQLPLVVYYAWSALQTHLIFSRRLGLSAREAIATGAASNSLVYFISRGCLLAFAGMKYPFVRTRKGAGAGDDRGFGAEIARLRAPLVLGLGHVALGIAIITRDPRSADYWLWGALFLYLGLPAVTMLVLARLGVRESACAEERPARTWLDAASSLERSR